MISTSIAKSYPRNALTERQINAGGRLSSETTGSNFATLSRIALAAAAGRDSALERLPNRSHRAPGAFRRALGAVANFLRPSRGPEPVQAQAEDTSPASKLPRRWAEFVMPQPETTDRAMGQPGPDGGRMFSAADLDLLSSPVTPSARIPQPRREGQVGGTPDPMAELATYFDPATMDSIRRAVAATHDHEPAPLLDA